MGRRAHHRACVFRSLSAWLSGAQLQDAMDAWDNEFAHLPLFSLGELARRVLPDLGIHIDPDSLRDRVMGCLRETRLSFERDKIELPPPPPPKAENKRTLAEAVSVPADSVAEQGDASAATSNSEVTPSVRVFCFVMNDLIKALQSTALQSQAREELLARLGQEASDHDLSMIFRWLDGQGECPEHIAWTFAAMQNLVHWVYVRLCEAKGPSAGDRYLTQAVLAAEGLPEAAEFNPRRLL